MLYKVENKKLIINNTPCNLEHSFDVSAFKQIRSIAFDNNGEYVAWTGIAESSKKPSLYTSKVGSSECTQIYSGDAYDLKWLYGKSKLLFNSGNTICMIDSSGENYRKLFKFSNVTYSPIMLSLNPNDTKIAFTKWKSDSKRIVVFDLDSNEDTAFAISCYDYSWLDNKTIVYSLSGGIKSLDVNSGKTSTIFKDAKSLRKIHDFKSICSEIERVLQLELSEGLIINSVSNPKYFNGRLYFEVFVTTDSMKQIGILSVKNDLSDLVKHFTSSEGLIRDYDILDAEGTIAVSIEKNYLMNEKINSGTRYYRNNSELHFYGYESFVSPSFPTKLIIIDL